MAVNVTMPKLGLTMETGKITEWRKKEGDQVKEKDILLVVETEKITYEVESPASGILHIISPVESEVPVAELIGLIAADKAEYDKVAAGGAQPAAAAPAAPAPQRRPRLLLHLQQQKRLYPLPRQRAVLPPRQWIPNPSMWW